MSENKVGLSEKYKAIKDYSEKTKERSIMKQRMIEKVKTNLPPLSKLNNNGDLQCIVCNEIVKNVNLWTNHLKSENHLKKLKMLKQKLDKKETSLIQERESDKIMSEEIKEMQIIENQAPTVTNEIIQNNIEDTVKEDSKHIQKEIKHPKENINIFEQTDKGDAYELPAGFFDDPQKENNLLSNKNFDEKEKQLHEEIKIFNKLIDDEAVNFENENLEEERQIYEEKINNEVENMIEYCERVNELFDNKSNFTEKICLVKNNNEYNSIEINSSFLSRKRKMNEITEILSDENLNKKQSKSCNFEDIFQFDWKRKGI